MAGRGGVVQHRQPTGHGSTTAALPPRPGRSFGPTTMLLIRADALTATLGRSGLAMWTWLLGEKIHWLGSEPQPQRAEVYAAA